MTTDAYSRKWWALAGLSLLAFTAFLDFTIVSTAMPYIQAMFNASVVQLQWVTSIYAMTLSMFMIAFGKMGDIYDRRKVFYLGFLFFGVASVGAALSPTINWLIAFRALQGLGAAIVFTLSAALLTTAFPKAEQSQAIGIYSAVTGLGLAIGPFLGGLIITAFNWRFIFWVNIPIIIVGLIFCLYSLQPSARKEYHGSFDWLGLFLLIVAIGASLYGLNIGEQIGWHMAMTWVFLLIGLAAFVCLAKHEFKHKEPLLNFVTFTDPYALLAILTCVCAGLLTNVFLFFDPLYFKIIRHYDAITMGLLLMALPIGQVIVSLFFSTLTKRVKVKQLLAVAVFFSIVGILLNSFFSSTTPIAFLVFTLVCMGFTWGFANTGSISIVSSHFSEEDSGTVIATIYTCWNIAGGFLLILSTVIFNQFQMAHLSFYLQNNQGDVSLVNQQHLQQALADPDHAASILHSTGSGLNHLYDIFQEGFLSALQHMSWVMAALSIVVFLAACVQIRRIKD